MTNTMMKTLTIAATILMRKISKRGGRLNGENKERNWNL